MLRVAETFAVSVDIWDDAGLFAGEDASIIADVSCGAFARGAFRLLDRAPDAPASSGRLIATCLREDAVSLPTFRFRDDDVVAIGNEYDGLPETLIGGADVRLHIPMPATFTPKLPSRSPIDASHPLADPTDGSPVLSSAMTAGILCYAAHLQSGAAG